MTTSRPTSDLAAELDSHRERQQRLEAQVAALESESRRLSARFVESERAHSDMLQLYIAYRRLGESADGTESLIALQDILSAVLGCEEFVIYRYDEPGRRCLLEASCGVDPERYREVAPTSGPLLDAVSGGSAWMREPLPGWSEDDLPAEPVACVPLKANGRVLGVALVFGMLSQKLEWNATDRALFQVLEHQGGKAFYQRRAGGGDRR